MNEGFFSWDTLFLLLVGMIFTHAATNVINDYFDHRHGVDKPDSATARYRRHPILEGVFQPRQVLAYALVLYSLALALGVYFIVLRGWPVFLFSLAGGLASFFYTAGPVKYKHHGLGELSVFLMWGPLMIGATYFIQTGGWHDISRVILASLPQGLWVALVLYANNLKDIDYDKQTGVSTIANVVGKRRALLVFIAGLLSVYLIVAVEALTKILSLWALLVFASLPLSVRLIYRLSKAREIPPDADPQTAQTGMIFGIFYVTGFLIKYFLSSV